MTLTSPPGRNLLALLVVTVGLGATACTATSTPRASAIVCNTAYRVSQSESPTEPDTMTLPDEDSTQSIPYIYLELHAQYTSGVSDGERALRLWVTPTGDERVLVGQVFQFPSDGPTDQFVGGHGFTGLSYAYDPVSGAELQYWCATG